MAGLKNGHIPQVLATEYASYRDEVIGALSSKLIEAEQCLLRPLVVYDPMAGTAPLIPLVEHHGYTAHFNDLNSLHLYVNSAKSLPLYRAFAEIGRPKLLSILCRMASRLDRCPRTATEKWIEDSVLEALILAWRRAERQTDSVGALTKAILLLAVRDFSSSIRTKNPTWLKPGGLRPKIAAEAAFGSAIDRLDAFYQCAYGEHPDAKGGHIILTDYDASRRGPRRGVDVVVTSPPFCNRVDWDRLYGPEHFFLSALGVWHTGTEFLGTTAVHHYCDFDSEFQFVTQRSRYLARFLKEVERRQIRKEQSSNYYVKYFTRYFAGLFRVFDMAAHVLREHNAGIFFVVQDNAHRGLLIDIGEAIAESLSTQGFRALPDSEAEWERHHMGLRNVSRHHRLVSPKQRERIWHAVRRA